MGHDRFFTARVRTAGERSLAGTGGTGVIWAERFIRSTEAAVRLSGNVDPDLPLAPSTVHRLFAAHGFRRSAKRDFGGEPDARAFTHPHAGDLWMSDIMHSPRLQVPGRTKGRKTYLYGFLDDATRMVPFGAFYVAENAACFQNALKEAILRRLRAALHPDQVRPVYLFDTCHIYVEHRLASAGCDRPIFSQPAIESIYNATGGVMRRVDAIAHHALAAAAIQKSSIVDIEHVQRAAEEIRP